MENRFLRKIWQKLSKRKPLGQVDFGKVNGNRESEKVEDRVYSAYNGVYQQLKTTLESVSSIERVDLGEEIRLTSLPLAIINPEST